MISSREGLNHRKLSRKEFVSTVLSGGILSGVAALGIYSASHLLDPNFLGHELNRAGESGIGSYLVAGGLAVGSLAAKMFLSSITIRKLNPETGNYKEIPTGSATFNPRTPTDYAKGIVGVPLLEELLYRGAVGHMLGMGWQVGIPASVFFALRHNVDLHWPAILLHPQDLGRNLKQLKNLFDFSRVPVTQFVGGLVDWYLLQNYSLVHAALEHVLFNGIVYGSAAVLKKVADNKRGNTQ